MRLLKLKVKMVVAQQMKLRAPTADRPDITVDRTDVTADQTRVR